MKTKINKLNEEVGLWKRKQGLVFVALGWFLNQKKKAEQKKILCFARMSKQTVSQLNKNMICHNRIPT